MKTKTKIIALMEVAVVLCSVFLVALPGIAAEQNQEMQEVSASANTITTASEDDYVLGVYGNANEDDTIDMRDLTYVKLIFFGKKPETELADAKYDGKINPLDFIQIKLIIVGKEKELTILQYIGLPDIPTEPVTVPMPIESIIPVSGYAPEVLCAFGVADRIVGVLEPAKKKGELKTFLEDKPTVGTSAYSDWDLEKILELEPDIVIAYAHYDFSDYEEVLTAVGIPLVQMDFHVPEKYSKEIGNLGWMLDKQERAEELINFEQQHLDLIEGRVKDLEAEQKPRVYWECFWEDYKALGPKSPQHDTLSFCGGVNIFADTDIHYAKVDPEAVIDRNPEVIIKDIYAGYIPCGYDVTDTGPLEELRSDIMNRPAWDDIDAVKNGRVYLISFGAKSTHACVHYCYIAKWLHPELFEDIDPVDIHGEWMEKFLGIEYKGAYAYPLPG